ncbi:hypothetical protein [Actinokineospora pegani]|uniref:hypothetical protein n=1 Tax=Actinokineospora pegani TaxID=2654637 RepID=UPI0012EACBB6|nr:hypothetical protein [Actinokineospora pegani]
MLDTVPAVVFAAAAHILVPRADDPDAHVGTWPVYAFVLPDAALAAAPGGPALLTRLGTGENVRLLDRPARWSVLSPDGPLLRLELAAAAPEPFALGVAVAAHPLLRQLPSLAAGATVGVTTDSRASALRPGIGVRDALGLLALARAEPLPDLAELV